MNNTSLDLEAGSFLEPSKAELEERGYQVNIRELNSGLHGTTINDNALQGGADPRREGLVLGE